MSTSSGIVLSKSPDYLLGEEDGYPVLVKPSQLQSPGAGSVLGPYTHAQLLALSTAGLAAGTTLAAVTSPPQHAGIWSWDGTRWAKPNPKTVSAAVFGFVAGTDCTAAFAALASWFNSLPTQEVYEVVFGPGTFYADEITFGPLAALSSALQLTGVPGATFFTPNPGSTAKTFFTIYADFWGFFNIQGIQLRGAAIPNQSGLAVLPKPRSLDGTAGLTYGRFDQMLINGFDWTPMYIRGGFELAGPTAFAWPMQFFELNQVQAESRQGSSSVEFIGQVGQISVNGGDFSSNNRASTGAGLVASIEYRALECAVSAVDPAADTLTNPAAFGWPPGTPCRIVGTSNPGGVSRGTTYYAWPSDLGSPNWNNQKFKLSASAVDAANFTAVNLTGAGTIGAYSLVAIYAVSLASNEYTCERSHFLVSGDKVRFRGSNLPSGLSTGTDYYIVRTGHEKFKLATSYANALAGVAISISGGTLADYGWIVGDDPTGASGMQTPYSIIAELLTVQTRRVGVWAYRADIELRLHTEELDRAVIARDSACKIHGGFYANSGHSSTSNGAVFCSIGSQGQFDFYGAPRVYGESDTLFENYFSSTHGLDRVRYSTTTPVAQTNGVSQFIAESGGVLYCNRDRFVVIPASANQIHTIDSAHVVDTEIVLVAWGGTVTLNNTNGIRLPTSTLAIPDQGSVTLRRVDLIGPWVLVSKSF